MRVHDMAVASVLVLTLALGGCYPKNKGRDAGAQAIDRALARTTGQPSNAATPPAQVADVAAAPAGQAAAGTDDTLIETSDEKLATGQFYDAYPLDMQANTGVDLTVHSSFKPVIIILDTAQQPLSETTAITQDPDGSWTLTARQQFDQGGRYFVIVAAEQVGATGSYTTDVKTTRVIG